MNNVVLTGRLTADPQTRNGETTIARYTLAVDRQNKDKEADFISCVCFGRTAEFARDYLKKGTKVGVIGRIQTGSYTNKDGQKVYTTDVIVNNHEFMESRKTAETEKPAENYNGFVPIPEETELPFR